MSWVAAAVAGSAVVGAVAQNQSAKSGANAMTNAANKSSDTQLNMFNQIRQDQSPWRETGTQALNNLASGMGLDGYYPGVTTPLSFDQWASQNQAPTAGGGSGGNKFAPTMKNNFSATSGMPLPKVLSDVSNKLDPIGLFGKKKKSALQVDPRIQQYQDYLTNFKPGDRPQEATPLNYFNNTFGIDDFEKDPGYQFRMDEGTKAIENSAAARGGLLSGATLKAINKYGQDFASNEYGNAYNRFNNDLSTRFNRLASLSGFGQTAANTIDNAGMNTAARIGENQLQIGNARAASSIATGNAINNGLNNLSSYAIDKNRYGRK